MCLKNSNTKYLNRLMWNNVLNYNADMTELQKIIKWKFSAILESIKRNQK